MTARGLGDATIALVPTTLAPVYEVRAPGNARAPWHIVSVRIPDVSERSMAHPAQAHDLTLTIKCVAGTGAGVRTMFDTVHAAIEGARPEAAGWTCGPLGLFNTRWDPTEGTTEVPTGSETPIFEGILEYRATATKAA